MASKSQEKNLKDQQLNLAIRPLKNLLKNLDVNDLIKFNAILSAFPEADEFDLVIYDLAAKLAFYLLQNVPDDPELTSKKLDDYFPEILKENKMYFEMHFHDEASKLVAERWPDVNESVREQLELTISGLSEMLYVKTLGIDQYLKFVKIVSGTKDSNSPKLSQAFDILYQDILASQEFIPYLGADVTKVANRYLF